MAFTIVTDPLPILPDEISYGFPGGPGFINDVVILENRHEQRNNYSPEPNAFEFDIGYLIKTDAQAYRLRKFFMAVRGRWRAFRMKDWEDYKSCAVDEVPSATDIEFDAATAGQTAFQLEKVYVEEDYETTLTIYKPKGSTIKIAEDGIEVTSGWTVNEITGIITRGTPLAGGEIISWGGEWFHKCRFNIDKWPHTPVAYGVGSIQVPVCAIP